MNGRPSRRVAGAAVATVRREETAVAPPVAAAAAEVGRTVTQRPVVVVAIDGGELVPVLLKRVALHVIALH